MASLSRPRSGSPLRYNSRKPPPSNGKSHGSASRASKPSPATTPVKMPLTPPASTRTLSTAASSVVSEVSSPSTSSELNGAQAKESVSVTVRFRPLNSREIQKGDEAAWYADGDTSVRSEYNASIAYAFDKVFGPATTTRGVYDVAAQQVVAGAMEGVNGTVFAYGVTSSGKTHTMHGDQKSPGIIPLAVKDVFNIIQETPGREFLLRVSYLEIYNEVINDLLDTSGQNLRIREDVHGTYVESVKEEVVLSPAHALSLIAAGEEHRHVGSNNFNLMSSRSHTIFTLTIESSARGEGSRDEEVTLSQLNLIDLAGSESSKTETTGLRRKEGSYINKSLLTLGTVISKLTEGKASHVPYRDSKLTRLLQSSLSGHGRVSLICTVTPASSTNEETHNTLKFAHRAKNVELNASANKILDEKSLIKKYQKEITSLKHELDQLKRGMFGKSHPGTNQDDLLQLRRQLEAGQVKLQSRLEEEEQAKAALMGRIQRLTKLILVSTKTSVPPGLPERQRPSHRRRYSFGEEELAYLPDKRRDFALDDDDQGLDLSGEKASNDGDEMYKDEKKAKKRGVLSWFKTKKHDLHLDDEHYASGAQGAPKSPAGRVDSGVDSKETKRKVSRRMPDELPLFAEATQAGDLFSGAVYGRRIPATGTTMADQMDLLREQVKMLAGEVAFCTSSLKRLTEQATVCPDDQEIQAQILKLKDEIHEKKHQMQILERKINAENIPAAISSQELSQNIMKIKGQLNEKIFELEIKSADNRILQEQLQSKNAENDELQTEMNLLKQQLQKLQIAASSKTVEQSRKSSFLDADETSDWLNTVDLSRELRFVEGGAEGNGLISGFTPRIMQKEPARFSFQAQMFAQATEIEKLRKEISRILEEKRGLEVQGQKLAEDASYAKELATAAAVELKHLAEEVTKLSSENTKLSNDLAASTARRTASTKSDYIIDELTREALVMKDKITTLQTSIAQKEENEALLNKRIEEGKQREANLENDLAGMWVVVAKLKKDGESKEEEALEKVDEGLKSDFFVEELKGELEEERRHGQDLRCLINQIKGDHLEDLESSALEELQNLHVEALTKLCKAKAKVQERIEREKKRETEQRAVAKIQADSIASIGVHHLLLEEERNGHVCKVCFEAPTAAVLLPCRHFCLCKSCAIACTECPLCRSSITDRIITFT